MPKYLCVIFLFYNYITNGQPLATVSHEIPAAAGQELTKTAKYVLLYMESELLHIREIPVFRWGFLFSSASLTHITQTRF